MHSGFLPVVTAMSLLVAASTPALAQSADGDVEARASAERTLDRSRRLRQIGGVGAAMSLAAILMSEEQRTSRGGAALAVGGVTALGLGLIGDFAQYRGKSRLDVLDRDAAGGLGGAARAEAERALRQGRRLRAGGQGLHPGHRCGGGNRDRGPHQDGPRRESAGGVRRDTASESGEALRTRATFADTRPRCRTLYSGAA